MSGLLTKKWFNFSLFSINYTLQFSGFGRSLILALNFLFLIINIEAKEIPPIIRYLTSDYKAGNQNWKISQDANNFVYFANNDGLLEFNGAEWNLYPSPNETIIRSVKVFHDKIYTGCYMEFGYWERQNNGKLKYFSLSSGIRDKLQQDEHFWEIIGINEWILFQSLHRIYIYNIHSGKIKIISPDNGIWRVFALKNEVYYQSLNEGLYQFKNGVSTIIMNDKILINNQICNIFDNGSELLIQTEKEGLFILKDGKLSKYNSINSSIFNQNDVFSSTRLKNGNLVLGTISNGVFILSKTYDLLYHITQENGLSNNTVLSLFEDKEGNLWIGLDNGINCLNLNSSYKCFVDKSGLVGTVYTTILHNNFLYLGTNQGLFAKRYNSNEEFIHLKGTKGQVWTLFSHDGILFCGHNKGTFIVDGFTAQNIFSSSGTWKFNLVPDKNNFILQGNYYGLSLLKKENGKWKFAGKIQNFDISSRYFEIDKDLFVFISHEYKGIFRLKLNKNLTSASVIVLLNQPERTRNAGLIKFNNSIIYFSRNGFFKLDSRSKEFSKYSALDSYFNKSGYISGKLAIDQQNRLWQFTSSGLTYFHIDNISPNVKRTNLFLNPELIRSISGYENIQQLNDSRYLIGTSDGYIIFDLSKLSYTKGKLFINKMLVTDENEKSAYLPLNKKITLNHNTNSISISYNIPNFNRYIQTEYQYKLEGYNNSWSQWNSSSNVIYKKIPPGKYTFIVKGKTGDVRTISTTSISFEIKRPFYATNLAIFIYILILLFTAYLINKSYSNYYTRQRNKLIAEHNLKMEIQQLENEQKLIKSKNIELVQNVDEKSKELAFSTLDLIRKNDLLKLIKEDIKKHKDSPYFGKFLPLLSDFNENISRQDSWKSFRESYDNIDKDFIKKLHSTHKDLSPSELKLCAYLRLNLSSKEIAPILNISVKSVEIKRYRLRKKLRLAHSESLSNYILNF